jgi:hypothetical protein
MSYALLRLLYGSCNSMGLPEIRFHNPLQKEEEPLFNEAVETIKKYSFMIRIHSALFNKEGFDKIIEFFHNAVPESKIVYIPDIIMHGDITFRVCLKLGGFEEKDKGRLLEMLMETGIPVYMENSSSGFSEREAEKRPIPKEVIEAETKAIFSQKVTFCSEN